MNLCFISEVRWDSGTCARALGASGKHHTPLGPLCAPRKVLSCLFPGTLAPKALLSKPSSSLSLSNTATLCLGVDRGGPGTPAALGQDLSVDAGRVGVRRVPFSTLGLVVAIPTLGWAGRASHSPLIQVLSTSRCGSCKPLGVAHLPGGRETDCLAPGQDAAFSSCLSPADDVAGSAEVLRCMETAVL